MSLDAPLRPVLTYCMNVLPAQTLAEVRAGLASLAVPLAAETAGAVGLYLSQGAVRELREPGSLERFRAELASQALHVCTLNGFPYGGFHDRRVKEQVYVPGWHEAARSEYTVSLAEVLAALLPEGASAPISTLSGTFKNWHDSHKEELAARALARVAEALAEIEARTGREIVLALEPEPFTTLETTREVLEFFQARLFEGAGRDELCARGHRAKQAESLLRRFVGVCYDTCHQAVEFERAAQSLRAMRAAGIRIAKVQLSSALRFVPPAGSGASRAADLARFDEPRYLHQTFAQTESGSLERFVDLGGFLDWWRSSSCTVREVRSHFHLPIDLPESSATGIGTTRADLREALGEIRRSPPWPVLEVETYTFDVFPDHGLLRDRRSLVDSVRAEILAAKGDWEEAGRGT